MSVPTIDDNRRYAEGQRKKAEASRLPLAVSRTSLRHDESGIEFTPWLSEPRTPNPMVEWDWQYQPEKDGQTFARSTGPEAFRRAIRRSCEFLRGIGKHGEAMELGNFLYRSAPFILAAEINGMWCWYIAPWAHRDKHDPVNHFRGGLYRVRHQGLWCPSLAEIEADARHLFGGHGHIIKVLKVRENHR